jgi:hypothetical protein
MFGIEANDAVRQDINREIRGELKNIAVAKLRDVAAATGHALGKSTFILLTPGMDHHGEVRISNVNRIFAQQIVAPRNAVNKTEKGRVKQDPAL